MRSDSPARPTRADLEAARDGTVDPVVGPGLRLLIVGINPGLWTAAVNAPFARPGNRFWPALAAAGILPRRIDAAAGLSDADRALIVRRGVGITNLVDRATARADELDDAELRNGVDLVRAFVARHRPRAIAVAGITAYRVAFGEPHAVLGRQPRDLDGIPVWAVPNPSGLNAHETIATIAAKVREPALAAGIDLPDPSQPQRRQQP